MADKAVADTNSLYLLVFFHNYSTCMLINCRKNIIIRNVLNYGYNFIHLIMDITSTRVYSIEPTSICSSSNNPTVVSCSKFIDRSNPHTVLCGQVQTSDI